MNLNKRANSKVHALGRNVAIVYECGSLLAAHVSVLYALRLWLIRTNLKAIAVFSCLFICYFVVIFNQGDTKYQRFLSQLLYLTTQRPSQNLLELPKCGINFFQTSKNDYIYMKNISRKFQVHSSTTTRFMMSCSEQVQTKNAILWSTSYKT